MAVIAITLAPACSQAGQGTDTIPDDPLIAEKRAACFHPESQDQPFEFAGKKIFLIQLDSRDHREHKDRVKNPGRLLSKLITKDYETADTLMFWDYSVHEVGYYPGAGAKAYSAHLKFCLTSRHANDTSLYSINASPYRTASVSPGGYVLRRKDVYAYADQWLNAKFKQKPVPKPPQQAGASRWNPCRPLAEQMDDNLQRYEPLSAEEVKRSCYERLQKGWTSYRHVPDDINGVVPGKL